MRIPSALRRLAGGVTRWSGVVGLNYHRIGDGRRSVFDRGLWSATAEAFDQQVRWLKSAFDVITPEDLPRVKRNGRGRHVLITFDDGYADNHDTALPILTAAGARATFFIATGYLDDARLPWWDEIAWMVRSSEKRSVTVSEWLPAPVTFDEPEREQAVRTLLRAYKRLPGDRTSAYLEAIAEATGTGRPAAKDHTGLWMTWNMVREMRAAGMTIGGHTVRHQVLARLPRAEQWDEISGCARRLREELDLAMDTFSYPVGTRDSFNTDTLACLREAGVTSAFSYYGGFRSLHKWDDLDIPRIPVEQDTSFDEFRALVMFPWAR